MSRSTSRMIWTSPNDFETARKRTIGAVSTGAGARVDVAGEAPCDGSSGLGGKATLQSLDEDRGRVGQREEDEPDDRERLEIAVRPAGLAQGRAQEIVD